MLRFEPSLDAFSLRSDVISSLKVLSLRATSWRAAWLGSCARVCGELFQGSGFRVQGPGSRV